jgi:hypothetical protein
MVVITQQGGVERWWVETKRDSQQFEQLVFTTASWQPEGIIIYPKTADAPYGYGPPRRSLEAGGEVVSVEGVPITDPDNERLTHVLINRYQNNNYPECDVFIPPGLYPFSSEDGFTTPAEQGRLVIGEGRYTVTLRPITTWTFTPEPQDPEEESDSWYAHWPEELPPLNDAEDAVFLETNALRESLDKDLLHRPLKGFGNPAFLACLENVQQEQPGRMDHSSLAFRLGFRNVSDRVFLSFGYVDALEGEVQEAENIQAGGAGTASWITPYSTAAGLEQFDGWLNSPPHYASMVAAEGMLCYYGGLSAVFDSIGDPIDEDFSAVPRSFSTQSFINKRTWLLAGAYEQITPYGAVSFESRSSWLTDSYWPSVATVMFRGRAYPVKQVADLINEGKFAAVIGAALRIYDSIPWLVAIIISEPNQTDNKVVSLLERPLYSVTPDESGELNTPQTHEWLVRSELALPTGDDVRIITRATFTPDGIKAVFSITKTSSSVLETFFSPDAQGAQEFVSSPAAYAEQMPVFIDGDSISLGSAITPPNMNYVLTYEDALGDYKQITQYTVSSSGTFSAYPFYDLNGDLEYLQMTIDFSSSSQNGVGATLNYTLTIAFPSGKQSTLISVATTNGTPESNSFISYVSHLHPVHEDLVTMKTVFSPQSISVIREETSIAVNNSTLHTWPTVDMSAASINTTMSRFDVNELPHPEGISSLVPLFGSFFDVTANTPNFPLSRVVYANPGDYWRCPNKPGVYYYPGKMVLGDGLVYGDYQITGSHPACMSSSQRGPSNTLCQAAEGYFYGTFALGIPTTSIQAFADSESGYADGVWCTFARYQDQFACEIAVSRHRQVEQELAFYWDSSLDLESMCGVGPLESIGFVGVI